jgi:hypothetical protein
MRRTSLYASTALGIVVGAVLINAIPAYADLPTIDIGSITQLTMIKSVLDTVSSTINDVKSYANSIFGAIGDNTFGTVQQLLQEGFTQNANYSKAQISAARDIADGQNTAMAGFHLQVRQAQIRDEHTVSPNACVALDGGVSTAVAAVQAYSVAYSIQQIHTQRGQAQPGMPSYYGQAQAVASMAQQHLGRYCDQKDVDAGLCSSVSSNPDGDSNYGSFFVSGTYADQTALNAAKDYATNLIQPVAPAALRGNQLSSIEGQDAAVRRRGYDARMSLAFSVVDEQIGMQSQAVPITAQQSTYLINMGLTPPSGGNISWFQSLQIEAERRVSDVNWAATLHAEPPAAVERENAQQLALSNFLQFQNFHQSLKTNALLAAILAETTDRNFLPISHLPVPSVAASN